MSPVAYEVTGASTDIPTASVGIGLIGQIKTYVNQSYPHFSDT